MTEIIPIDDTAIAPNVEAIKAQYSGTIPETVLILGSGLGRFGEVMEIEKAISYEDIPSFPVSTVAGHAGLLLIGRAGQTPLMCMQGRMHIYEGYSPRQLAIPIRTFQRLGVKNLILTNAAGGLNKDMGPGTLMIIRDHINFSGVNPLIGPNDDAFGSRFFDMSEAYDAGLRSEMREAAKEAGLSVAEGVYLHLTGPNFETPTEVRLFAQLGADAVGMSTVPECLVARHCGMKVVGVSLITNLAAGIADHAITHDETMAEGEKAFENMSALMLKFLARLGG